MVQLKSYVTACREAALAGGMAIADSRRGKARLKSDASVGQHAIVTEADYRSQEAILNVLGDFDDRAWFMTEEIVQNRLLRRRLITSANVETLAKRKAFIIDELDGSSSHAIKHYEWSISVGYVENLVHKAGAVFAPEVFHGVLFFASPGEGAYIKEHNCKPQLLRLPQKPKQMKQAYIIVGPDNFLTRYPLHNKLLMLVGDAARTVNGNGSCALAMGLVASGRADALIQPLQSPWDWAAGKLLIEEAGGKVLFYEVDKGRVVPIKRLEARHYNPVERAVGFVAAHKALASMIMERLLAVKP